MKGILALFVLVAMGQFSDTSAGNIGIKSTGDGSVINNGIEVPFSSLTFLSFNGTTNLMTDTPSFAELGINSFSGLSNIKFSLTPNVVEPIGSAISLKITIDVYNPNNTVAPIATLILDENSNFFGLDSIPLTPDFFNFNGFSAAGFNADLVLVFRDVNIKINSTSDNPTGSPPAFIISTTAVPEPATMLLLGTGLIGLRAVVRRRRRTRNM